MVDGASSSLVPAEKQKGSGWQPVTSFMFGPFRIEFVGLSEVFSECFLIIQVAFSRLLCICYPNVANQLVRFCGTPLDLSAVPGYTQLSVAQHKAIIH